MLKMNPLKRLLLLGAVAVAAVLLFAACGDDDEDGEEPDATATMGAEETPGAIDISGVPELEDGKLTVGSDIAYAPMEFYEEGTETATGVDVDMGAAIAEVLGVEIEFINTGWDGIIPALTTEDFDVIMSAMTITEDRQAEIDFVPYLIVGSGILVPAGNPDGVEGLEDLCGLTVAVQVGTIQVEMAEEQNEECEDPINIVTFDTNPLAVEDLRTEGSEANIADFPVAYLDAQESDGELEVIQVLTPPSPYGIGVRKGSTELKAVLEQAVDAIIAGGQYDDVLEKWDLTSAALP